MFFDNDEESSVPPWNPFHASFESRAQKHVLTLRSIQLSWFRPVTIVPSTLHLNVQKNA